MAFATAAARGVYLLSFMIESYVDRIVEFAASKGKRSMAAVRLALQYAHPAPFVPSPNERLVVSKRRRRGELLGVETRPESGQSVPEGRDAAFCRNAGTGHGDDALAGFQQRRRFVEQGGGIELVVGHAVDPL